MRKERKAYIIAGFLFVFVLAAMGWLYTILGSEAEKSIQVTAHRGDQSAAPENTVPAFERAILNGADWIELDVTQTNDGVLVILHDDNLLRTTGLDDNIWNITFEELNRLDAGSYYSHEFAGTKVPTLREVMDLCRGKIKINIEIKSNQHESDDFVEQVVSQIKDEKFEEQCIVSSFDYEFVQRVKQAEPNIKTAYIFSEPAETLAPYEAADGFSIYYKIVSEDMVREAEGLNKPIYVWTVNEEEEIKRCMELKIDNIITNNPMRVKEIIEANKGFS